MTNAEVIRLATAAGFPMYITRDLHKTGIKRLIELAKEEENEAIIAAANALENIASTSSSTRIRRVANEALTAIRARRN